ncbi:MAG: hypothetical protein HZA94_02605 [Candidatus Vogelbacteria bacterium]|nr:hypothetical protein [Candidatus Vogelbacteria bacterium]
MQNLIIPIIILAVSGGVFLGPTRTLLDSLNKEKAVTDKIRAAVASIDNYKASFDIKNEIYSKIGDRDKISLEAMVPSTIDNVKLIIDLNQMAVNHNRSIKNIAIKTNADSTVGPDGRPYGTVSISFSISSSLSVFEDFLKELESSLRLIDVVSLSFVAGAADQYDFSLEVKAYWLKQKQ